MIDSIYEDKWYQTPKSAGAGHYNMPKGCATLLCCACVDETICVAARYPTLRICGYMARNACPCGRKNPLPFPFSEQSPLSDFRQIRNKGNGIHKGGNLGVHPCAPARRQRRFRLLRKQLSPVSRETKSALLWNRSVSRETSALCVRNIDRQRNSLLVFLPVYGCTDSGVHHHADRPIECIQEKPHILNKPHNIILMRRLR